eukprot:6184344-Pleurochrysis_carterae.AAC.2
MDEDNERPSVEKVIRVRRSANGALGIIVDTSNNVVRINNPLNNDLLVSAARTCIASRACV